VFLYLVCSGYLTENILKEKEDSDSAGSFADEEKVDEENRVNKYRRSRGAICSMANILNPAGNNLSTLITTSECKLYKLNKGKKIKFFF